MDAKSLKLKFTQAGTPLKARQQLTARDVFKVLTGGDLKAVQIRETEARAEKLELENAERRKELFPREEVERVMHQRFQVMQSLFRSLPTELSNKVNPADPEHAYTVMDEFLQGRLPEIRKQGEVKV